MWRSVLWSAKHYASGRQPAVVRRQACVMLPQLQTRIPTLVHVMYAYVER